eukprot:CAMPEP_0170065514 /NCGR_PEP_ID=MMETSP0019_2-20121128/5567_1 /TAXON_ID=98059 /ORGANISM="Dinobryon sp., Strain UTEXLB2267" /LENGTH=107 /DNA_ID=CAMNT_0010272391 /DNA_START=61 /DNA_END=381 /DNA_ORIENTATION=+
MDEVVHKIRVTEESLRSAEREGDISSRDFFRTYLIELQREKNLLLQQQAPPPPAQAEIRAIAREEVAPIRQAVEENIQLAQPRDIAIEVWEWCFTEVETESAKIPVW